MSESKVSNSFIVVKLSNFFKILLKYKFLYIMAIPGITLYIVFSYIPMYGITLAFKKFMFTEGIMGSPWVGFANFSFIFRYKEFWTAFGNTLIISFGKLLFGFPVPIILALLLNELSVIRFKKVMQSILYLPHFLSWIIVFGIVYNMVSVTSGTFSKILVDYLGIQPPNILTSPEYFRPMIYITDIWKGAGWGTIIYLAAIAGISAELYESAIIDGANRFKRILFITLPSLKYAIIILFILNIGNTMQAGFDQIFNFYNPSTYKVGDIIDTFVYRVGITQGKYEVSTAIGLFQSVINCFLLVAANRIVKLFGEEGLF